MVIATSGQVDDVESLSKSVRSAVDSWGDREPGRRQEWRAWVVRHNLRAAMRLAADLLDAVDTISLDLDNQDFPDYRSFRTVFEPFALSARHQLTEEITKAAAFGDRLRSDLEQSNNVLSEIEKLMQWMQMLPTPISQIVANDSP